jgi:hypothetical protein
MTRLYRKRPRRVTCQRCGQRALDISREVLHFSLTKVTYLADGRMTMRGAGSIDLCELCWATATAGSRIRRRPLRKVAA